ncbi:MAG: ABC transporter substrate-binding protein [Campylobacteraceae bacterium]|jgi:ABC-type nitrate/sulfonate/bicarbonate transport system substrate-binding protein|nr:ABC transporter substrate-binding protein [Campylobacteraceae bacterium]
MLQNSLKKKLATSLFAVSILGTLVNAADDVLPEISLQKSPWTVIALEKGFFKDEFNKVGTKKVTLIAQGAAELLGAESAAVGSGRGDKLAIAQRMVYPSTVHRINGLNTVIIWISEPSNRYRTPILTAADNGKINSLKDLEGKNFSSSRISCYWSSPFESLNEAGIPFDSRLKKGSVRHENIDNSNIAIQAVIAGKTDATAVHLAAPAFTGSWLSGKLKVVDRPADDGVYVNYAGRVTYVANKVIADKYPQVIRAFLEAREKTREWATDHPNEAAAIISKELRVPTEVALFQITHLGQWEFMGGEASAEEARKSIKEFLRYYIANGDDILTQKSLTDKEVDEFIDGKFFAGGSHSIYKTVK